MRLWHESLLPLLPRQQLLGQHRECAALRGLAWGRKHATVDYVFRHSPARLAAYHLRVIAEMQRRGYRVGDRWLDPLYRGQRCPSRGPECAVECAQLLQSAAPIYPEHDRDYLQACLNNLERKGIHIELIS